MRPFSSRSAIEAHDPLEAGSDGERLVSLFATLRVSRAHDFDLTETNPTRDGLHAARRALPPLSQVDPSLYEPSPAGAPSARAAVSRYYAERGLEVAPERVVLTASTSEAYAWLFKLLCDPGDEVLIPSPSYPLFQCLAALEAVRLVPYPLLRDEDFRVDVDAIARLAGPRARAIIVVSPNNPTGTVLLEEDAARLEELASERGLSIIADEVFGDYVRAEPATLRGSFAGARRGRVFVLSGLSKVLCAPQLKLGWIALAGQADELDRTRDRLELVADTFLSVATPVQLALGALLDARAVIQAELRERIRTNLEAVDRAARELDPAGLTRFSSGHGGWTGLFEIPRLHEEDAWVRLFAERARVLVHPGWFYELQGGRTFVVSLIVEPRAFELGVRALLDLVRSECS
ncbi:MAG: pyridoxal phosphate-dependent aminotransferase [Polyangiaceae bacterium]